MSERTYKYIGLKGASEIAAADLASITTMSEHEPKPVVGECRYSKDNNIPEHRCAVRCIYADEASAGGDMQALREENERLRACVDFTMSDASRLLRKSDVQDVCPHPDECFYEIERARCGPCAVKASALKGIAVDDTHSHLPEVCRLRRDLAAAEARANTAEQRLKEAVKVLEMWDALIKYQYSGSRDAMSDMVEAAQATSAFIKEAGE